MKKIIKNLFLMITLIFCQVALADSIASDFIDCEVASVKDYLLEGIRFTDHYITPAIVDGEISGGLKTTKNSFKDERACLNWVCFNQHSLITKSFKIVESRCSVMTTANGQKRLGGVIRFN